MKRMRMQGRRSRKLFTRGAQRVHKKNLPVSTVMRGGIRL